MGRLGLGTISGFKTFTLNPDIPDLSDAVLQAFIDRAEAFLDRNGPFLQSGGYNEDMTVAVYKTAEILWSRSSASMVQAISGIMQSERIGTYSYNKGNAWQVNPFEIDTELAEIIRFYRREDSDFILTTTLVFKEIPPSELTGKREYKDVSNLVFQYIEDGNIKSGDPRLRNIV